MPDVVIVALGSNEGDRYQNLIRARNFLAGLAISPLRASSIYDTEPVGPSDRRYYNAIVIFQTDILPSELLKLFKAYEKKCGRNLQAPRWTSRVIDLDIIAYGEKIISSRQLIVPHPEYSKRLFVLLPMQEIIPGWRDPENGRPLQEMISTAPKIDVKKLEHEW